MAATEVHLDDLEASFTSRLTAKEMDTLRGLLRKLLAQG